MFKFTILLAFVALVSATPTAVEKDPYVRRDADAPEFIAPLAPSCTFPSPPKTSVLSAPQYISGTFDGGNVRFERKSGACGSGEGGEADTVFVLNNGATLQNVVIGKNQMEGVYCKGACTINNVWFEDVCEDAISGKGSGTVTIRGGGAKNASDKVVQHNGNGSVVIDSYCVQTFGKLYRSCGNCSTQYKRTVTISNIIASNGDVLAGINSNYGDVANINKGSIQASSVSSMCDTFQGLTSGEPKRLTRNVSNANCKF